MWRTLPPFYLQAVFCEPYCPLRTADSLFTYGIDKHFWVCITASLVLSLSVFSKNKTTRRPFKCKVSAGSPSNIFFKKKKRKKVYSTTEQRKSRDCTQQACTNKHTLDRSAKQKASVHLYEGGPWPGCAWEGQQRKGGPSVFMHQGEVLQNR